MYGMVPANRKTSTFSVPIKDKKWRISDNHYDGISSSAYNKYRTIEMRMHCGTTQAKKINGWIAFLTAIVNAPAITKSPKSIHEVKEMLKLSTATVEYIEGRIAKFASQHAKAAKTTESLGSHMEQLDAVTANEDNSIEEESEVA